MKLYAVSTLTGRTEMVCAPSPTKLREWMKWHHDLDSDMYLVREEKTFTLSDLLESTFAFSDGKPVGTLNLSFAKEQ